MPRNVRNFWIELEVDGKKTKVTTGPVKKDGGFYLRIKVRDDGDISENEMIVVGQAHENGELDIKALTTKDHQQELVVRGRR